MKFFDYIKKFFLFTVKEVYSFFLKLSLLFLMLFIFMFSTVRYFESKNAKSKSSKQYSYILFNPSQLTEDKLIGNEIFGNSEKYNISFTDILNSLDNLKNNDNIKGIIIDLDNTNISSAKSEELVKKISELKNSGKKIYAFGAYIDNRNYPLATIAHEVVMIPSASAGFSLTGYNYSDLYLKKLLDNMGIGMEVVRIGDYKSYGENYTSDMMSPGLKGELTRILDNRYNKMLNNISEVRKIEKESLNNSILNGEFTNLTPFTARDKKFVDKLESFQNLTQRLNITNENITDIYNYYHEKKAEIESKNEGNDTIAVIYAEGPITYNTSSDNTIHISPENIGLKLEKALNIKNLKGIVLRVNSPGGSALASEIIYQSLQKINVPIYVSMSETAASGGYYISMAGKKIFADNATITGSIGVVSIIPKLHETQKKYGITSNSISKGKYSDIYNPFTPLSEESRNKISESMEATYKEFKSRVVSSRKIDENTLENYAQGKIWLGDEAKNINLIDGIGGLEDTINIMAKDLNLTTEYRVENIYTEKDFSETLKMLYSLLFEKFTPSSQMEAIIPKSSKLLNEYKLIEQNKNKPMYYLPYTLEF